MIILTGGAGFIGSCFLNKLNENGIMDAVVVDHLGDGEKWRNLLGKSFSAFVHKTKFREDLRGGVYDNLKIDYIVHLGACSKTTERDADYIMDNNLNYSIELAEFALKRGIRFMYASSAATYGDGKNGYSDLIFDELSPLNAYGLSKHLFDMWIIRNKAQDKVTGFKYFNVFGPNEYHKSEMTSMIFKSFNQIKETGKVKLFKSNHPDYSDGGQMRDFVYVKDVIEIMWNCLESKENIGGIYNLGASVARSWNELANAVFAALSLTPKIEYIDMPNSLKKQYQNYTKADMTKLEKVGLRHNFYTLEESVKDYVCNYLDQNYKIL
jgi:ADP-L-glycero-D-manno-heptose 6-epimerase